MKNITFTILKKELKRFFGDKRMAFTTILLPGVLIYVIYSLMGSGLMNALTADENYVSKAYVQNMPKGLEEALASLPAEWTEIDVTEQETVIQEITDKQADVLVIFPENFVSEVEQYDAATGNAAPNVEIYYNSVETNSLQFQSIVTELLNNYESSMANKLDINAGDKQYDCATQEDASAQVFSMMLPMLLMIFLYSGCMAVAPEAIAGEKERGTMATLLVTPMKRSSLALGKVFSLSIIALLSGMSSFIGTMLSLPKLMGEEMTGLSGAVYGMTDYIMLLLIILSTVLVLVSVISVISAFAKSVKEANTAVSPLMIVIMFVSLMPMFISGGDTLLMKFFIPVYNSVLCMNGIFSFSYDAVQVLITVGINLVFTALVTFVLTRIFNSEKAMFSN